MGWETNPKKPFYVKYDRSRQPSFQVDVLVVQWLHSSVCEQFINQSNQSIILSSLILLSVNRFNLVKFLGNAMHLASATMVLAVALSCVAAEASI